MSTDLFLALLDKENPRGHPLLVALLYAFCPAAARWWLAGADPRLPFDSLWRALEDRASGITLKEALSRYGFENLVEAARQYVDQVEAWRARHPGVLAPETLPTFPGGRIDLPHRFGLQSAIENLGGKWESFFVYVRAWAYLLRDWEAAMRWTALPDFALRRLALTLPGIRRPAYFHAWSWESKSGNGPQASRNVLGLIVRDEEYDQLRPGLARQAGLAGAQPWRSPPEVWLLEGESGKADHFDVRLGEAALPALVERLVEAAKDGPHAPLAALQGAARCGSCAFHAQCYTRSGAITSLALSFEVNAHSHYGKEKQS